MALTSFFTNSLSERRVMSGTFTAIVDLYRDKGHLQYHGENATQLAHGWQCAEIARVQGASSALQLAAWLHDIGHLLSKQEGTPTLVGHDDRHEVIGSAYLRKLGLSPAVTEPIALHVAAKRYLVSVDSAYFDSLSEDSRRSLQLQGGVMDEAEQQGFAQQQWAADAIKVRRWDEVGKQPRWHLPETDQVLSELSALLEACR